VIELLLYLFGAARGRAPREKLESDLACPKDNQEIDPGRAPSREVQARRSLQRGASWYTGRRYAFDGQSKPFARFSFAWLNERELPEAVEAHGRTARSADQTIRFSSGTAMRRDSDSCLQSDEHKSNPDGPGNARNRSGNKRKRAGPKPCPSEAVDLFYLAISTEATVMLSPVTLPFTVT
jgi:hypothetical protein